MKRILRYALVLLLGACTSEKGVRQSAALSTLPLDSCEAVRILLRQDLTQYQGRVDEASKNYQEEQWKVETAHPEGSQEKMSQLYAVLQAKTYDREILSQVLNLSEAVRGLKNCPVLRGLSRVKTLLETTILTDEKLIQKEKSNQDKQDAMSNKSNEFRILVEGEKEPVSEALLLKKISTTKDRSIREKLYREHISKRSKAWLGWGFRELLKARNEEAKLAGFSNYYEYRFFRSQLDLGNYRALANDLKKRLSPKLKKVISGWSKKEGLSKAEIWDLRYLRTQAATGKINDLLKELSEKAVLDLAKRFWSGLGMDVDAYKFTMDLYPRPGKNTHAFAMGIVPYHVNDKLETLPEPKPDIRFLANLKVPVLWDDISTVIHELGHAIHYGEIRQPLAIFRSFGGVETEAIAMTVERMADSEEFLGDVVLKEFTRISEKERDAILKTHETGTRIEQAMTLLRQVFFSDFEHEMYKDPDADFATLWARMHREYWGVDISPELSHWDVDHFLMAPVYVQSYALGIIMVEQFYQSILKEFGTSYRSVALGDKLKRLYFAPGLEFNYLELTEQFTGKPLASKAALELVPR